MKSSVLFDGKHDGGLGEQIYRGNGCAAKRGAHTDDEKEAEAAK